MEADNELEEETLNRADLKPKKRLNSLLELCKSAHINGQIPIKNYIRITEDILLSAKRLQTDQKHEEALKNYLRYQSLVNSLRTHPNYKTIPIGKRSAFDYKLKNVMKNVKVLTDLVLMEYQKIYQMSKFEIQDQVLQVNQEQRPTLSTVRTFVSSDKYDNEAAFRSQPSLEARDLLSNRKKSGAKYSTSSTNQARRYTSDADYSTGARKSIFPTKQVKDFDAIHSQRRIVKAHRTVIVPSRITTVFSYLSLKNTKKNIETVAFLAGKELNDSQFIVSQLVLPEQVGFSDYFKVKDSHELIKYLEKQDLLVLGWIHSHPLESNYLSSSDMHYHCIFQSVFPEAIAIVFSPKYMKSEIFNLTPNYGLKYILNCKKKGFHPHPTHPPLTMVAQHAVIDLYGDLLVKDFRNERKMSDSSEAGLIPMTSNLFERMLKSRGSSERFVFRRSEVSFVHIGKKSID